MGGLLAGPQRDEGELKGEQTVGKQGRTATGWGYPHRARGWGKNQKPQRTEAKPPLKSAEKKGRGKEKWNRGKQIKD